MTDTHFRAALVTCVVMMFGRLIAATMGPSPKPHPAQYGRPVATDRISWSWADVEYDRRTHIPCYVLECLTRERVTGSAERSNRFFEPDVPDEFKAKLSDYKGSGYDRGHMAPAADFAADEEAMGQSFNLANMCPQDPSLNRGLWAKLEDWCREQTMAPNVDAVWIVSVPIFRPSRSRISYPIIGGIHVPTHFAKSILVRHKDGSLMMLAFLMSNAEPKDDQLDTYRVTTDTVEAAGGLDLWSELPDEIEEQLESQK